MTSYSKILAGLNLLGALVSVVLLASTWFTRGVIVDKAQSFALEKTRAYLDPVIPGAERLLDQPIVSRALPKTVRERLAAEIEDYRKSPDDWLLAKARSTREQAAEYDFPEITNPLARKSLDFLTKRLAGASAHFKRSFDGLIRDLRIFATTNLVVFLCAAGLCLAAKTPYWRFWLSVWSALLLVASVISVFLYIDQMWVWNILMNRYQGWTYAGMHLGVTIYLAYRILPSLRAPGPQGA
jgi:hypothetical protein